VRILTDANGNRLPDHCTQCGCACLFGDENGRVHDGIYKGAAHDDPGACECRCHETKRMWDRLTS
jgi:hypothetical protein